MEDCPFCKIANKEIPSYIVYEDNDIIAVLDIYPANPGQIIIMPKNHVENIENLDDAIVGKIFVLSKYLSFLISKYFNNKGLNIVLNSGEVPGRKIKHLSIYIVPRFDNDSVKIELFGKLASKEILESLRNYIINNIGNVSQEKKKEEKKYEDKKFNFEEMEKWFKRKN